ncbi:MAG: ribosome hibernation-promoting factor, HPF/YfiA family, partial [Candidatus Binatia bacterium]
EVRISVTFRHVDPTQALKEYAAEKVTRVTQKYLRRAVEAHVILSVNKRRHQAEINVHAPHFDISAHESTDDLYSAIDKALDKVEAQMRKHKERLNRHKGSPGAAPTDSIKVDVIDAEDFEESGVPRVVEADNIPAKPLSLEDAIVQLELMNSEFFVFRNSGTDVINVVYKRRDGNYGLISADG